MRPAQAHNQQNQLTYRATGWNKTMDITFPKLECWNPVTEVASIAAKVDKNRVLCTISLDLLKDRFGASSKEPMQAVADNRKTIQAAALKLIENNTFEDDGSVIIRADDIWPRSAHDHYRTTRA